MCGVRTLAASTQSVVQFQRCASGPAEVQAPRPSWELSCCSVMPTFCHVRPFFVRNAQCLLTRMTCTNTVAGHRVFVRYLVLLPLLCSVGSLLWVKRVLVRLGILVGCVSYLVCCHLQSCFPPCLVCRFAGRLDGFGCVVIFCACFPEWLEPLQGPRSSPLVWWAAGRFQQSLLVVSLGSFACACSKKGTF